MSRSDLADIAVRFWHETSGAILVSETDSSDDGVWLPKSKVEFVCRGRPEGPLRGDLIEVTLPQWLATEKGLV